VFVTNTGTEAAVFRDDAGKHWLEPWQSLEISDPRHLPAILTVPGMVEGKVAKPRRAKAVTAEAESS